MRDPYSILGVGKNADQQEIKAAWRNTAKALHPDQNPDDPQAANRFTEAGRAYDLLKDPNKRALFDDARARAGSGKAGKEKTFMEQRAERARAEAEARAAAEARARAEARAAAAAAAAAAASKSDASPEEKRDAAEEVVAKIFGTNKSSETRAEAKPETKQYTAPPQEPKAAKPMDEPAQSHDRSHDRSAESQSQSQSHDPRPSPALELISYVLKRLTRPLATPEKAPDLMIDVPVSIEDILNRINPAVTLADGKLLSVTIPDDAKDGTQIRLEGYGHRLPNVKRGDVVATLRIKPHNWYRPHGYDLQTFVDIDIENAVLGCEATVETPDGPSKVTIPPWTGSHFKTTIAGRGLPKGHGMRGNLVAEVRVLLWDRPDQKVIDLMRSLREGLYL